MFAFLCTYLDILTLKYNFLKYENRFLKNTTYSNSTNTYFPNMTYQWATTLIFGNNSFESNARGIIYIDQVIQWGSE